MKNKPERFHLSFDTQEIALALNIKVDDVVNAFKDGRVAWRFAEFWAGKLYGVIIGDGSTPIYDASRKDPVTGGYEIAIRTIGKTGIKFQRSRNKGSGRTCTTESLLADLKGVDYHIIVDMRAFPEVNFVPIRSKELILHVNRGNLTCSGWSGKRFDAWVSRKPATEVFT